MPIRALTDNLTDALRPGEAQSSRELPTRYITGSGSEEGKGGREGPVLLKWHSNPIYHRETRALAAP